MNLLFKPSKKHDIKIIIFFVTLMFGSISTFASEKQAGPVIASVNINSCVGSITLGVTSGVAPYTYAWEDSGGNPLPSTIFIADNLTADNYADLGQKMQALAEYVPIEYFPMLKDEAQRLANIQAKNK